MNMITFSARSRARIITLHKAIISAIAEQDGKAAETQLYILESYTRELAAKVNADRINRAATAQG
jgi:hypothetical protein